MQIKNIFEEYGFFRSVEVQENIDSITISVVEYPSIKKILIKGNTLYPDLEILYGLGVKINDQFNSRLFQESLSALYKKVQGEGYTHWQLVEVAIGDDGVLRLEVDEGLLQEVMVKDDLIHPSILRFFFSDLLGKPFNALKVKYVLEELLFSGVYYSIDSEVIHQKGKVILKLVPDQKRLRHLHSGVEYSTFGGFVLFNHIGTVKKSGRLGFMDIESRYIDDGEDGFLQLSLDHYNFRRNLRKSSYSTQLEFFYTSLAGGENIFFEAIPRYSIPLIWDLMFSLALAAGIHKNFDNQGNELIAEFRASLEYTYVSPLNRTELSLGTEWVKSILHHYSRKKFSFSLKQNISWVDLKIYGLWNAFSGDELPFNYDFFPFEKAAIMNLANFYSRDLKFLSGEFASRPVWGFLRIGILLQYIDGETTEWGYGIVSYLTILGFPLRFTGFMFGEKIYLSAGVRLSF